MVQALTPQKIAYLSTLTLGFGSWYDFMILLFYQLQNDKFIFRVFSSSSPYLSDQSFSQLCLKLYKNTSSTLQNLSLLIFSQGIMEESFRLIYDLIDVRCSDLQSFNLYFEAYVSNEASKEKAKKLAVDMQNQLDFNNVEINCWRAELYKKK